MKKEIQRERLEPGLWSMELRPGDEQRVGEVVAASRGERSRGCSSCCGPRFCPIPHLILRAGHGCASSGRWRDRQRARKTTAWPPAVPRERRRKEGGRERGSGRVNAQGIGCGRGSAPRARRSELREVAAGIPDPVAATAEELGRRRSGRRRRARTGRQRRRESPMSSARERREGVSYVDVFCSDTPAFSVKCKRVLCGRFFAKWPARTEGATRRAPVERDRRGTGDAVAPHSVTHETHTTTAHEITVAPPRTDAPDRAVKDRSDGPYALSSEEAPWGLKVYLFRCITSMQPLGLIANAHCRAAAIWL